MTTLSVKLLPEVGFVALNAFISGIYFSQLATGASNERTPYAFAIHLLWMVANILTIWRDLQRIEKND